MPKERLAELMDNVVKIRQQIDEKCQRQLKEFNDKEGKEEVPVQPFMIKLSTKATNPEGLHEREIQEREQRDKFPCYSYKKRKLF